MQNPLSKEHRELAVQNLVKALEIWGPGGERWCRGHFMTERKINGQWTTTYCLWGGVSMAAENVPYGCGTASYDALSLINQQLQKLGHAGSIPAWNDHAAGDFNAVKSVVCAAIKENTPEEPEPDGA